MTGQELGPLDSRILQFKKYAHTDIVVCKDTLLVQRNFILRSDLMFKNIRTMLIL
jgi:hypothetical protein